MAAQEIVLITGGARSGKSRLALQLASTDASKIFVATAEPLDREMEKRIQKHRMQRGDDWLTIEEPVRLAGVLTDYRVETVVIDCITLWISNLMMRAYSSEGIEAEIGELVSTLQARRGRTIVVTNEVGMGIVPEHASGRFFRDIAGHANQMIAAVAQRVILMVSGLPLYLK